MPDIENSRKTAKKGAEWVPVKQPKNSRKNSRNTRKTVETAVFPGVSAVFPAVFRLFDWDPLGTFFGCFPAVFKGAWHLCRWPQMLQAYPKNTPNSDHGLGFPPQKKEGAPEMGMKPLKALRGYQASSRCSNKL